MHKIKYTGGLILTLYDILDIFIINKQLQIRLIVSPVSSKIHHCLSQIWCTKYTYFYTLNNYLQDKNNTIV